MNVWEARVVVRERSVAEIADLAVRFTLVLGGSLYLRLALWLMLPAYALCDLLLRSHWGDGFAWCLAFVLFAVIQLPFTVAAGRLMFSPDVSVRIVLATTWRLLFRGLRARLVGALLVGGGSLLVVLVPFAIARALYLTEVVVLEGSGAVSAYQRTSRLTSSRTAQTLGVWLSLLTASTACIAVCQVLGRTLAAEGLAFDAFSDLWHGLSSEAGIAGLLLSAPLVATLRFLAYIDNRTRREGWDIQVRFMDLGRAFEGGAT